MKKEVEAIYELSLQQQGILFESLTMEGTGIHVEQVSFDWFGKLDLDFVDRAWQRIVDRHGVFRTSFVWKKREVPVQAVIKGIQPDIAHHDLSIYTSEEQESRIAVILQELRTTGFDFTKPPLFKVTTIQLGDNHFRLALTIHHVLLDGWSQGIVLGEFFQLYHGYATGHDPRLVNDPPYRNYIKWLKSRDMDAARDFWTHYLKGFKTPTRLGQDQDKLHPVGEHKKFGQRNLKLSAEVTDRLNQFINQQNLTFNTVVQGIWGLILNRYSQSNDLVFGTTVAGRSSQLPRIQTMVGLFINTLPFRVNVDPDKTVAAYLNELQLSHLEIRDFEHCSAGQIHDWSELNHDTPLFETILVFENYPLDMDEMGRLVDDIKVRLGEFKGTGAQTHHALTLLIVPGKEVVFKAIYDKFRLDEAYVDRVLTHIEGLLRSLILKCETPLRAFIGKIPDDQIPRVTPELTVEVDADAQAEKLRADGSVTRNAPISETEFALADIWRSLFDREEVSVYDNFFKLGGHSLLAARAAEAIRQKFNIKLPLYALFQNPCIANLAVAVDAARAEGSPRDQLPRVVEDPDHRLEPFPLTDIQHAYWVGRSNSFQMGEVATHGYLELDVRNLDLPRLAAAWNRIIKRHGMLRAVFNPDGTQQVLEDLPEYQIQVLNALDKPQAEQDTLINGIRETLSHQVFDPASWPLFEVRVTLISPEVTRVHMSFDLLITDAMSFQIIAHEWTQLYDEPQSQLPPLTLTFRDYMIAERELRASDLYRRSKDYWLKRIPDMPEAPALPLAKNPDDVEKPIFGRRHAVLTQDQWRTLKNRAQRYHVTPSVLLMAIFSEILETWSTSPRFCLNLTIFNRLPMHEQVNQIVGDFTSVVLLEVMVDPEKAFAERARLLQDQLWKDMEHSHFSGVEVIRELSRGRAGNTALMPIVFTSALINNGSANQEAMNFFGGEVVYGIGQTSQVWLDHQVQEIDGCLDFVWDAVEELFPPGLLDDMFEAYVKRITRLAEDEDLWSRATPLLVPEAQLLVRDRINHTKAPVPDGLLHGRFFKLAAEKPHLQAVISNRGALTYAELAAVALGAADFLTHKQTQVNTLVAVIMHKGWEQIAAVMGILRAGAAYLPIDPNLPEDRRLFLLEQGGVQSILTTADLAEAYAAMPNYHVLAVDSLPRDPRPIPADFKAPQQPADLAYVIFTSGSTGTPKGVAIDHRGALNTCIDINSRFKVGESDRILGVSSLSFDLSVWDIFGGLSAGAAVVLPDPGSVPDPSNWRQLMVDHAVTIWNSAPPLMQILTDYLSGREIQDQNLRLVMLSGDWIPLNLPAAMDALFPNIVKISMGGATEASIWSIIYQFDHVLPHWKSIPYGIPMVNQRWHVLDSKLRPKPNGVIGDLFIAGVGLAKGYWRDDEKTAASFITHPKTGERLYRTGDLGRYDQDAVIEFQGRGDFQVKIQGHRIELGEIETALANHQDVDDVVVTAVGKSRENKRLVAYVVQAGAKKEEQQDAGGWNNVETDPIKRLEFKLAQHGVRKGLEDLTSIQLFPPEDESTHAQAFIRRQSHRDFEDTPVDLTALSNLLAALGRIQLDGYPLPKYQYPSAGNLYPVQTYVYIKPNRVEAFYPGVYYYDPAEHALIQLSEEAEITSAHFGPNGTIFQSGAFAVCLIAQLKAIEPLYGAVARDYCLLEAGYMSQLLMQKAPELNLGLCPVGGMDFDALREAFQLDDGHLWLHALIGGAVAEAAVNRPAVLEQQRKQAAPQDKSADLAAFLEDRLPAYMVPSAFVFLERLPLTATGKIDRKRLPMPESLSGEGKHAYEPPANEIEAKLIEIWQKILDVPRVGALDNFFELGGHSLSATQVTAAIREHFRADLVLKTLFDNPTLRELAQQVDQAAGSGQKYENLGKYDLPRLVVDPDARHQPFPLTDVQQAYWVGRSGGFELGEVAAHGYMELEADNIDYPRLDAAWRKVIARHDMLRAVVLSDGMQQILAEVPHYTIPFVDLAHVEAEARDHVLDNIREEMSHQVFDPLHWPIFDIRCTQITETRVRIHLSFDLIIADAWSFRLLTADWFHFYENPDRPVEPLDISFRDYIMLEEEIKESALYEAAHAYWAKRIVDLPGAPQLPLVKDPKDLEHPTFVRRDATLSADHWQNIRARAKRANVTTSVILFTAYAEVLSAWSQNPDFTLNLTLFNRLPVHPQVNDIVGDFTSLTLLSYHNRPGECFVEKARRTQKQLWEDMEHRYMSGVEVLREMSRYHNGNVLMPVVFTSIITQDSAPKNAEVREAQTLTDIGEPVYSISQTSQVWLDHQVMEENGGLSYLWDAIEDLFPPAMLDDMFGAYHALLVRLAQDESFWETPNPVVTPEAHRRIYATANHTHAPIPQDLLHSGFLRQARSRPNHPAVIDGDTTLSYGELLQLADRLGWHLRHSGVKPNTFVAVVMEKGWEQVVAVLGVHMAGAAYVPMDPGLPNERLRYLYDKCDVHIALTQSHLETTLQWPDKLQRLAVDRREDYDRTVTSLAKPIQNPTHLAYVIFTSGSTGEPKGVAVEHRAALNTCLDVNARFNITPEDRVIGVSSLSFDLSVFDIFGTLTAGATLVLPDHAAVPDPAHWADVVKRDGVTIWNSVPALVQLFVDYLIDRDPEGVRTRLFLMSGDWIPLDLPNRLWSILPKARLISMGGATEAAIWSIIYPIEKVLPEWKSIPYGKAMVNQEFYVLDKNLNPCPVWTPGDLYIGGIGLARCYWGDDEKTAASFIHHPVTGQRLYRTGDLGRYYPDGNIEFLGRSDFQVKVGGYRIELGEIEARLLKHSGVREVVVAAVGGRHDKRLVAYLVPETGHQPAVAELREFLLETLPAYMTPNTYVTLERLPLTSNGKVDRKALPEPGAPTAAKTDAPARAGAKLLPQLTEMIKKSLDLPEIQADEDLLRLGANSVDMIRIINMIETEMGVRPSIRDFFMTPTLATLARLIAELQGDDAEDAPKPLMVQGIAARAGGGDDDIILDPLEREKFKNQAQARLDIDDFDFNLLLEDDGDEAQTRTRLLGRRTFRQFDREPVSYQAFARLLTVFKPSEINGYDKYHYPSAGSTYSVQVYLHVREDRVEDVPAGLYYYDPLTHGLGFVSEMPQLPADLVDPFLNAPVLEASGLAVFLVCQLKALRPLYGSKAVDFALIEAGAMVQALMDHAMTLKIGFCPIGMLDDAQLAQWLRLDQDQVVLHALLGGAVDPDADWSPFQEPQQDESRMESVPLLQGDPSQPVRLTFSQERLWFLQQLDPESTAYNESAAIRFKGPLNVDAFNRALAEIIRRHDSTRTRFVVIDDIPHQVSEPFSGMEIPFEDLSGLPQAEREDAASARMHQTTESPFVLTQGQLIRPLLLKLDQDNHIFFMTTHHIIGDLWSAAVLQYELTTLYNAFVAGQPSPLPQPQYQYADYARWQRAWLTESRLTQRLDYWQRRLKDAPVLELPTDRKRPPAQSFNGGHLDFQFGQDLHKRLKARCDAEGVSLFMVVLTAYQTLLSRYSGQADISVGIPIANRHRAELEGMLGFFVNNLVMRTDLDANPTFKDLIQRVRQTALEAYAHQDAPFEKVVDACVKNRDMSRTPLFQVVFDLLNVDTSQTPNFTDLTVEPVAFENHTAKFDIILSMQESSQGLGGFIEYNSDLFFEGRIQRLVNHLAHLLELIADQPQTRIHDVPLITAAEEAAFTQLNRTVAPYSDNVCLHQLFEKQAAANPNLPAAQFEEEVLSYDQLNRRANRLAHHLIASGVRQGDMIGVCFHRSLDMLTGLLGVLKAGATYVPMDVTYPDERISYILDNINARFFITQAPVAERFPQSNVPTLLLDQQTFENQSEANPNLAIPSSQLAYIIFTSGSTGKPKGVILQHRPVVNLIEWVNQTCKVGPGDRLLFITSLCFDLSVYDVFGTLAAGATIYVASEADTSDAERLIRVLETKGITFWDSAPAALQQLTPFMGRNGEGGKDLRLVFLSGDWIPLSLPPALQAAYPNVQVMALGGATEAAIWSNHYPVKAMDPEWKSVPYGKPIQNARYYVLDHKLERCPVGVPGDLYIGGNCLSFGYYKQPALTAARYLPDPYSEEPGGVLYTTGDRARYFEDGNLEFLGRLDNQVKIRGFRIELEEIEARLADHPHIQDVVVLAREISFGNKQLAAFLVTDEKIAVSELRTFIAETLPAYMVPSTFTFLEAVPLTSNGKVDRKQLLALEAGAAVAQSTFTAPATPTESMLEGVWRRILKREKISTDANFFEVGGDSLLATQLISHLRNEQGIDLPLRTLFAANTIIALAAHIDELTLEDVDDAELAALLAEVEDLSDDEARDQL